MANTTVRGALQIHGANPQVFVAPPSSTTPIWQFLVEKIIRTRIWESNYWKEHCFALTAETLIDKAIELKYIGGVYGNQRPTEFISLLLKLLQIQPEKEILIEYLLVDEFKPVEVFELLEPLLKDYRKLRVRSMVLSSKRWRKAGAKTKSTTAKGNVGPGAGAAGVVVPVGAGVEGGLAARQVQSEGGLSHEARPVQGHVPERAHGRAQQRAIDPVAAISPQTGRKKTEKGGRERRV
ncbi:hypothetical protein FRB90_011650 [Tulasnella sp. 427]|nr:hypothetical protein FRB90_011650 [Tulasnella sp. 427]